MYTKALVADPRFDLVQQGDILWRIPAVTGYMSDNVEILDMGYLLIKCGKFMEMGCEQAESMYLGSNMPAWRLAIEVLSLGRWVTDSDMAQARPNPS